MTILPTEEANRPVGAADAGHWLPNDAHWWKNPEDGAWNPTEVLDGRRARLRAGVLIVKDGMEILLGEEESEPGVFSLPGGAVNKGETIEEAAVREAEEEIFVKVKNAEYTGITYMTVCDDVAPWVKEHVPEKEWWIDYKTFLVVGEYDGIYGGNVKDGDIDASMATSAKFYKIEDAIKEPSFKKEWKQALIDFGYIVDESEPRLTEATRSQLLSQSRSAGAYKGDTSRGKNRFERKKYSKVAPQVKSYNQIDMNQFFKQDILEIKIPVTGETNEYTVTVKLNGVVAEMARNIKSNQNKFEYRTVLQALTKIFNTTDVYVKCTCDDFRFRLAHWAIVNNYSADGTDKDPGPGKGIVNPNNDKGRGCKHILLVLNNQDWMMKVASVIHNYINYAEEHMMKPFQQIIFPKLYGVHIDGAADAGLVPEDANLETEKHIIEVINDWARNRGKYKPGTNRNPINDKRTPADK